MPANLTIPFALAALFTGGCIVIQRLEQHADRVTEFLSLALLTVLLFVACGLFGNYIGFSAEDHQKELISQYKSQFRATTAGQVRDFGTD